MSDTKSNTAEIIKAALRGILFGLVFFLTGLCVMIVGLLEVLSPLRPAEYEEKVSASVTKAFRQNESEYDAYVSFRYANYPYDHMLLENVGKHVKAGDTIDICVYTAKATESAPQIHIRSMRLTAYDKKELLFLILCPMAFILVGFFIIFFQVKEICRIRRLYKNEIFTGVIKRCFPTNMYVNGYAVYRYVIVYSVYGAVFWKSLQGSYGQHPDGQVVRVYVDPEHPEKCTLNLEEYLSPEEYETRTEEARDLLLLEVPNDTLEYSKSKVPTIILLAMFLLVGIGLLIGGFSVRHTYIMNAVVMLAIGILFTVFAAIGIVKELLQ